MAVWAQYRFYIDGQDVTQYVKKAWWDYGRDKISQLDGRSIVGASEWELDNSGDEFSSFNTGSSLYGHILPNKICTIEMKIGAGAWTYKFYGYLETVRPQPTSHKLESTAILRAHGVFGYIKEFNVTADMHTNITTGDAVDEVLDAIGFSAVKRDVDTGRSTIGRWWEERETDALTAIRRLEETECGFVREGQDGYIIFEDRAHRLGLSSQGTYSNSPTANIRYSRIKQEDHLDAIYNKITARVRTFDVTGDETILWTLAGDPPSIPASATLTIKAKFPSPQTTPGLLAVDDWGIVDVFLNDQADGQGNDVSGDFNITLTKKANEMTVELTNNGAVTGYLVLCRARGKAVVEGDSVEVSDQDNTSISTYGLREYILPAYFIEDISEANELCNHLVEVYKDPIPAVVIEIEANANSNHLSEALNRDVSDKIHIIASSDVGLYIDDDFFIERIKHEIVLQHPGGPVDYHKMVLSCAAVSGHDWSTSTSSYTPKTISTSDDVTKIPDDLWCLGIANGLDIICGGIPWKYNSSTIEAEFRAKFFSSSSIPGSDEGVDLRTPTEGGTLVHDGTNNWIINGLVADWRGRSVTITAPSQGRIYFAFRFRNAYGWSVWTDGNETPEKVKDCWVDTEDSSLADIGPPADWGVIVRKGPDTDTVIVVASRPKTYGHKIWFMAAQVKDITTGSWYDVDANTGAAVTHYDGSAIGHTVSNDEKRVTRNSGSGFGTASVGDLVVACRAEGTFDIHKCIWSTIEGFEGGNPATATYIDISGQLHGMGSYTDLRIKIVKPPWDWTTDGYYGGVPGNGLGSLEFWPIGGDTQTVLFTSPPIQVPNGTDLEDIGGRVWFENAYSRSDDDTYSGTPVVAPVDGYCVPIPFTNPLIIDCSIIRDTPNIFVVTLTGNTELQFVNGVCGQPVPILFIQDSTGSRVLSLGSMVSVGEDVHPIILSTGAEKRDYLGAIYYNPPDKYEIVCLVRGYGGT